MLGKKLYPAPSVPIQQYPTNKMPPCLHFDTESQAKETLRQNKIPSDWPASPSPGPSLYELEHWYSSVTGHSSTMPSATSTSASSHAAVMAGN